MDRSGSRCVPVARKRFRLHERARYADAMSKTAADSPSALIDARIRELDDWRGATLADVRRIIHEADPEIEEEWKWMGTPVWSHAGIVCTGETYKKVVKLTFMNGAALDDPSHLFNSSLDGNTRRAINIQEGEAIDKKALKALVREAVRFNVEKKGTKPAKTTRSAPRVKRS